MRSETIAEVRARFRELARPGGGNPRDVEERVLIPRQEKELLVEAATARAPERARVLDIGSGAGCIAISL